MKDNSKGMMAQKRPSNGAPSPEVAKVNMASNQIQFVGSENETYPFKAVGNQTPIGPNTKDTGREGVPTAIALMSKRKLGIKLPANFN